MKFIVLVCVCSYLLDGINADDPDYSYIIPAKEWESCPNGTSIPCGTIINTNGTTLRYERSNSIPTSYPVPSEDCPWIIQAPLGTRVHLSTTCFHHFHINWTEEYTTCTKTSVNHPNLKGSKHCGNGYLAEAIFPSNLVNFTVYFENGIHRDLGFTVEITFIGEEISTTYPDVVTTTPIETTTSDATQHNTSGMLFLIAIMITAINFYL